MDFNRRFCLTTKISVRKKHQYFLLYVQITGTLSNMSKWSRTDFSEQNSPNVKFEMCTFGYPEPIKFESSCSVLSKKFGGACKNCPSRHAFTPGRQVFNWQDKTNVELRNWNV